MIKVHIFDPVTNKAIGTDDIFADEFLPAASGDRPSLSVTNHHQLHGTFKSITRTSAGTTTIVTPPENGSLLLTDLLISGEKQASSTTEVRFTDGTETVTIFLASQVDAPPAFAHTFGGRFQGWQDARIDVITSGAGDATVTLGYVKAPTGLPYVEWDSYR
jgi:hypothetical protein